MDIDEYTYKEWIRILSHASDLDAIRENDGCLQCSIQYKNAIIVSMDT